MLACNSGDYCLPVFLLPADLSPQVAFKSCLSQVLSRGNAGQAPAADHPESCAYGGQWLVDCPSA